MARAITQEAAKPSSDAPSDVPRPEPAPAPTPLLMTTVTRWMCERLNAVSYLVEAREPPC
jgi:hypothetical protein